MASQTIRSELAISAQERGWLEDLFARFLDRVETTGANSAELEALRAILRTGSGDSEASARLETLSKQIASLLDTVAPERMTLAEASRVLGVNAGTLRRACWSGKLPGEKRGKTWFVHISDLERYLSGQIDKAGGLPMFDNDDPEQREELIQALQAAGLEAGEWDSGGGITHVIVPLLDPYSDPPTINAQDPSLRPGLEGGLRAWPHEASLYIATNSLQTTCDIGLMGSDGRTGDQVATANWEHVNSLEEAVSLFQQLWDERDRWLGAFLAGEINALGD